MISSLFDGSPFDRGDPGRDADHDARLRPPAPMDLLDEIPEHFLGYVEISNDPVTEWPDRLDVGRGSPDHPFGFHPHRQGPVVSSVDGNHRRFVEYDARAAHVHQRIGRAEVDGHVLASNSE